MSLGSLFEMHTFSDGMSEPLRSARRFKEGTLLYQKKENAGIKKPHICGIFWCQKAFLNLVDDFYRPIKRIVIAVYIVTA